MPLDLEEQEQLANLKAFWVNYGRWLALGILIAFIGYGVYWFYLNQQKSRANEASMHYSELITAAAKSDLPAVIKETEELQQNFSSTAYAAMAGLVAANLAFSINDVPLTIKQLEWVENRAKSDSFQSLARLRLATLMMDQKDEASINKAQDLLKMKVATGYEALQFEKQGDLYLIQNKLDEAKKSYIEAWNFLDQQKAKQAGLKELDPMTKELTKRNPSDDQRLLKVKIDSLGGF